MLTLTNVFVRALGFAYRIFLSRKLGSYSMGVFQLIFPIYFTAISIISSGLPIAVSRLVAEQKAIGGRYSIKKFMQKAFILTAFISIILFLLLISSINLISSKILNDSRTRIPLFILSPDIVIIAMKSVFKGYFYGLNDITPPAMSEIIEQLIRMGISIGLLYLLWPLSNEQIIYISTFSMVMGELLSLLYLHYKYGNQETRSKVEHSNNKSPYTAKDIINIALPITAIRLLSSIMSSINSILIPNRLIVSGMTNRDAVSLYGIISGMVLPLLFLPFPMISALSTLIIPNLSEDMANRNFKNLQIKINKTLAITSITAFMATGILVALGEPIGILLYEQSKVGEILIPLSCFLIFPCLQQSLSSTLHGIGKQNIASINAIIGNSIELLCIYFLIANPEFRIKGFIIAFVISSAITAILNLIQVIRISKLHINFLDIFIKPAFSACIMLSITRFLFNSLSSTLCLPMTNIIISGLTGCIIFLISLWATGAIPSFAIKNFFREIFKKGIA